MFDPLNFAGSFGLLIDRTAEHKGQAAKYFPSVNEISIEREDVSTSSSLMVTIGGKRDLRFAKIFSCQL
jgi:hypothetical protein